jgi:hypothetical protein
VPTSGASPLRVCEPSGERVPTLILRATTSGRRLRSARLLSGGIAGSSTNSNSSSRNQSMRRQRAACGAVPAGPQYGAHRALMRRSSAARAARRAGQSASPAATCLAAFSSGA